MRLRHALGLSLMMLLIGISSGYYFAPGKVIEKVKVVESRRENRDVRTTTRRNPDGSSETVVVDKTVVKEDKKVDSSKETTRGQKDWLVSASVLSKFNGDRRFEGTLQRRIIGDIYFGVTGSSDGAAGVGLSFRF